MPFNREAASYLWIGEVVKNIVIQKALQELCNRSLLVKTVNNKYQFQPVVREYIHQQNINLNTAHQQAIGYYSQHLKKRESWQVLEDVREYLEIIYHRCELKVYALTNESIYYCYDFLNIRGYYSVLVELYEQLIPEWQKHLQAEDRHSIINSLGNLGSAYNSLGEYQRAINYLQQSLEIKRDIGSRNGISACLNELGNAYNSLGEYPQAINYYQQSLEIERETGDHHGISNSLNNLGDIYNSLGKYQIAIDYLQKSLEIATAIGYLYVVTHCLGNLGNAYFSIGEYRKAINCFQQSLEIQREIGDRNFISSCLGNLGGIYSTLGEYQRAINYLQQSLEIKREIGDRRGEANAWFNLGITRQNLQQKAEAKTAYENARKLYQAMGLDKKVEDCNEAIQSLGEGDDK